MPSTEADVAAVLEPKPRRDRLSTALASFPSQIRRRGDEYAEAGLVGTLQVIGGDTVFASVRGTRTYETSWQWDGRAWEQTCSCPLGGDCKHAFALGRIMLQQRTAVLPATATNVAVRGIAASGVAAAVEQLRTAADPWSRYRPLQTLLAHLRRADLQASDPRFTELLEEEDPDLLCLRIAGEIAKRGTIEDVPAALRIYLERADLQAQIGKRSRANLRSELLAWAERRQGGASKQLRLLWTLSLKHGVAELTITGQVTSARLANEPRNPGQLGQLRTEAHRSGSVLVPEQLALLDALAAAGSLGSGHIKRIVLEPSLARTLLELDRASGTMVWADDLDEDACRRCGIAPGTPVNLVNEVLRIAPDLDTVDSDVGLNLFAIWPGGRRLPLAQVVLVESRRAGGGGASLAIADGALWPVVELPPASLRQEFAQQGRLPLDEQERRRLLPILAERFEPLRQSLVAHTRTVPVRPVLAFELRQDDWLQVRVYACPADSTWSPGEPDPAGLFEYQPERGWVTPEAASVKADPLQAQPGNSEGPAPSTTADVAETANEAWLEIPDPEVTTALEGWLDMIGAAPGSRGLPGGYVPPRDLRDRGWWLRFTATTAERFMAAWGDRPTGLYLGNSRLQRLLSGKAAVAPTLEIESSGTDWFQVSATWRAEGLGLTEEEIEKLRNATTRFVRLPSGWIERDAVAIDDAALDRLADLGVEIGAGSQRLTLWQLAGAAPETLATLDQFAGDAGLAAKLETLRQRVAAFQGLPEVELPQILKAELRPYQKRGLDFLCYTSELGIGAVLADDMGLGKTVQALAWLAWLKQKRRGTGPALVVCPASVVHNWVREAERFVPGWRILVLGRGPERKRQRKGWQKYDLIITNFALFRQDHEFWHDVELRAVIFDEAQNLKNPDATVTRVARKLKAKFRLALTGTPLENRALDLWSIVDIITPGYLGSRSSFSTRFDRAELPAHQRRLLAAKLRPILLRRMKKEVASELPERIEERIDCELTSGQRRIYLAELRRSRALIDELSETPDGLERNRIHVLAALTRLRQICCHPSLTGANEGLGSGKFEALFELLEPLLGEGHKVLVFSQFVRCLDLLAQEMNTRAIRHHVLTGQTTQREQVVQEFQEDPEASVFLISLKAGGTGLNLTAASYVVLFDPWWNPAVEAQAIDRSHRIGQDKTVIAYRLLSLGTVEEKIWELQQRKAELARDLLGEDGFARTLSRGDLEFLLAEA